MVKSIHTKILVNATPEKVWSILTDFKAYPNWNPFITSLEGEVKVGKQIFVKIKPPESKGMLFKPTILAYHRPKELKWIGKLLFKGLFDGEHKFELIDNRDGSTTFKHSEIFKGILVSFFRKLIEVHTVQGFEIMNTKLKELAEKIA